MNALIRFFIEASRLKTVQRPGWILRGVKNPETVADHAFRVLVLAWIAGKIGKLNTKKLLKLALVHSLSAVHIDYISPYDKLLETKSKKELVKKYPALILRAPIGEKGAIATLRFKEEEKAINQLTNDLPDSLKHEIRYLWLDFQQKTSREARVLWVLDKLENLVQAFEYKEYLSQESLNQFFVQFKEITASKEVLGFVDSVKKYFESGEKAVKSARDRGLIKFLLEIGKVKKEVRKGWELRGVKEPESLAGHSFRSALMAWIFSSRKRLDQEVLILMAAVHDLYTAGVGDITPYDKSIETAKTTEEKKRIVEVLPWVGSRAQKALLAKERLDREATALDKILKLLPHQLRHELKYYWLEYKTGTSKEGRFFRQVDRIEALLQALEYQSKDKNIPITSFWLQLKELLDDQLLMEFVVAVDDYYFQKGFKSLL